jgi:hypothetical protein
MCNFLHVKQAGNITQQQIHACAAKQASPCSFQRMALSTDVHEDVPQVTDTSMALRCPLVLAPRPAGISLKNKSGAVGTPAGSLRRGHCKFEGMD